MHTHHALFWKHRHANTLNELITVCDHCHTPANHQPKGKLWGLEPKVPRLEGATFMNIVRWEIINDLIVSLRGVEVCHTYGAISGLINGVNKTFTVSQGKYAGGSLEVYLNGQLQTQKVLS